MHTRPTAALSAGSGLGLINRRGFGYVEASVTTYQDNRYLDLLNKALRAELDCLHAFAALDTEKYCNMEDIVENHDLAIKNLSTLIIQHRGIPENHSGLSGEFGKAIIQLTAMMPQWIHGQAHRSTFMRSEKKLSGLYQELIKVAPLRDRDVLQTLSGKIAENIEYFLSMPGLLPEKR